MKLVALINKDHQPFGQVLNGLAHMSLGLGHRLNGEPDVDVYFASADQIKKFRHLAWEIEKEKKDKAISTSFPHTMVGVSAAGKSDEQVNNTAATSQSDINYLGACFVADDIDSRMANILGSCVHLKSYTPHVGDKTTSVLPAQNATPYEGDIKKASLLINTKVTGTHVPLAETINQFILANLHVGNKTPFADLYLADLMDKDGNHLGFISFHPYAIVKTDNQRKFSEMTSKAETTRGLVVRSLNKGNTRSGEILVTLALGKADDVNNAIDKKNSRLFNDNLKPTDLEENVLTQTNNNNQTTTTKASKEEEEDPILDTEKKTNPEQNANNTALNNAVVATSPTPKKPTEQVILFMGAGVITNHCIEGLIKKQYPSSNIMVTDYMPEAIANTVAKHGIKAVENKLNAIEQADIIFIAVTSKSVQSVAKEIAQKITNKTIVVCISSGINAEDLSRWIGKDVPIVRAMTSTSVSVCTAPTALYANHLVSEQQKSLVQSIFNSLGTAAWVKTEAELNSMTPVVGCGPAYIYKFMEEMEKAAIEKGIDPAAAKQMSKQLLLSAATNAQQSDKSFAELRQQVTSPGGITEASIKPLMEGDLSQMLSQTFDLAIKRCEDLSKQHSKDLATASTTPAALFGYSTPTTSTVAVNPALKVEGNQPSTPSQTGMQKGIG